MHLCTCMYKRRLTSDKACAALKSEAKIIKSTAISIFAFTTSAIDSHKCTDMFHLLSLAF